MKYTVYTKSLIYIVSVIGICALLNYTIPSPAIKIERDRFAEFEKVKDSIQSLTLGRSHGGSVNYNYWDCKGENFSIGGRDIASIKYLLEYYVPQMPKIKEVLICMSYSSLYYDNEALSNGNLNDARKSLYASVPAFKLISADDYNNLIFGKLMAFTRSDHGFTEIKQFSNFLHHSGTKKGKKDGEEEKNDSATIIRSAPIQAFDHSKDRNIALMYNPKVISKSLEDLQSIIVFLKAHNIRCVFFTPPFYKDYTADTPPSDIKEMRSSVNDFVKKYGVEYYDYSQYPEISNNVNFYMNADHMNATGKEKFTKILLAKLRAENIH